MIVVLLPLSQFGLTAPNKRSDHYTLDATSVAARSLKKELIQNDTQTRMKQSEQRANPDSRLLTSPASEMPLLEQHANAYQGISTGDVDRYRALFWEVSVGDQRWRYFASTVSSNCAYSGMEHVILWGASGEHLAAIRGAPAWGKPGVALSQMRRLPACLYTGTFFDGNVSAIVPSSEQNLSAIYAYCCDLSYKRAVKRIDKKKNATNATLVKVPFDLSHWQNIAAEKYPDGLPEPYSEDPTQWLFHGHPAKAGKGTALHVALARLCGYRWPAETDHEMHLSAEAREWVAKTAALPDGDGDGMLAVAGGPGEKPLVDRLNTYLAAAFGAEWSDALGRRLVAEADNLLDKKQAKDGSLEAWLRDRAFRQQCACSISGHSFGRSGMA